MITVKEHDVYGITYAANMDLTGTTVRLLARQGRNGTPFVLPSAITDAAGGIVTHTLTGTLAVGTYQVELEVTAAGEIVTFPTNDPTKPYERYYEILSVVEDIL